MLWRKLFNTPLLEEGGPPSSSVQREAKRRIRTYWRLRGWLLLLGEIILAAAALRWEVDHSGSYVIMAILIAYVYIMGITPYPTILWLIDLVMLFMVHGMLINGLGAVTALSSMIPYTFSGMLYSGRKRVAIQAWCVIAFWFSLMYEAFSFYQHLDPPRFMLVSYNVLWAAFTFQTLRFLNQLAVEINTVYVAEEVRQQSQQFLARVSHELRTPLNSVLGFTKMLRRADLTAAQQQYLHQAIDEGEHLNKLVGDLLDSAHLSTGKVTLKFEPCDVYAVCEVVAEEHRQHLKPAVALKLELSPFLPQISADTMRLRQILGNLVSNAIKHTEQGEICIKGAQHGPMLEIAVRDTGAGIPEDQQAIIFVPFVRLNDRTAGVGLGLDIALQLARLHGGDIRLHSVVGQGSTFTVELPIKRIMLNDGDKARH